MEKQSWKWKLPKLPLKHRILLYVAMILLAILSIVNVIFKWFPYALEIAMYVITACVFFPGIYYLILDLKHGITHNVKPAVAANPYVSKLSSNFRLRKVVFVVPGAMSNILFAVFNGIMGIILRSAWLGSLAAYYILLSVMRVGTVKEEKAIQGLTGEERWEREVAIYRKNSFYLILMVIVLTGMKIVLDFSQGGSKYPGIVIYVVSVYAFYKIIKSSINMVKIRKHNSPLLSIITRIGYVDACVSILVLQTAMFASFSNGDEMFVKIMNGATGAAICLIVLVIGIQGIWSSGKMKTSTKTGGNTHD